MCLDLQGTIASEEEDLPVAVEETYSGNYVVVFDPLDGCDARQSSIAQPALEKRCCTATILEGRICELTHCCWQQHAFSSVPPPQKGRRRKVHAFGPAGHPVLPRFETVIAQRSSSNIDAAISTGSIFGIYDPNDALAGGHGRPHQDGRELRPQRLPTRWAPDPCVLPLHSKHPEVQSQLDTHFEALISLLAFRQTGLVLRGRSTKCCTQA